MNAVTGDAAVWEALRAAEERGATTGQIVAAVGSLTSQAGARRRINTLTPREREVFAHLARGESNAQAAHAMGITEGAVKAHVSRLLAKLWCDNRVQAALLARDAGLGAP